MSLTRATGVAVPPRSSRKAKLTRKYELRVGILGELTAASVKKGGLYSFDDFHGCYHCGLSTCNVILCRILMLYYIRCR